jgi:DNA gyrase/topoisomerase IV subunit B
MDSVNIEISKDLIAPIVETKIKAALAEAFGDKEIIIAQVVERMLYDKVDETGKVGQYSSYNKYRWIDIALRNSIQEACKESMTEWLASHKAEIKAALQKQLESRKSRDAMAKAMVDGLVSATTNHWRFSVHFGFESPEDEGVRGGSASVPF